MDDSTRSFWDTWHDAYDDPESDLSQRLVAVQRRLSDAIDEAPLVRFASSAHARGRGMTSSVC